MAEKTLMQWGFGQRETVRGMLLGWGTAQTERVSGLALAWGLGQHERLSGGLLTWGLAQREVVPPQQKRAFAGSEALGIGDFDMAVRIGSEYVDMCQMAQSMTIEHAENESRTCDFVLQINKDGTPKKIDPYRWYGKLTTVDLYHSGGTMRVYRGWVNSVQADFMGGRLKVGCSDRRDRMIENVPIEQIRAIGYTSQSAHGKFEAKADELERRLQTVPASFEFDLNGNGRLVSWLPTTPKRTIGDCEVYYREPSLRLAESGQVVNTVKIGLEHRYDRLRERRLNYRFSLGLSVCQYAAYGTLPHLKAVAEAVRHTGWTLGGFDFARIARSGWHNCGGQRPLGHIRAKDSTEIDSGVFEIYKRWVQPVLERYEMTVSCEPSIARYGELSEFLSYSVQAQEDKAENWTDDGIDKHAGGVAYRETSGDRLFSDFLPAPQFKRWTLARDGDFFIDLDNSGGDFEQTWQVAYHTAKTKIYASHRQNTLDLEIKFLPEISLRHSHRIQHRHFNGIVKVARFIHTFDFEFRVGQTAVQYKVFQGFGRASDHVPALKRPPRAFAQYFSEHWLGRAEIGESDVPENYWGMIYRKGVVSHKVQLLSAVAFRVRVPEVEQQSTDTAQAEQKRGFAIGVPHDDIEVWV